jgi:transposase-like protein
MRTASWRGKNQCRDSNPPNLACPFQTANVPLSPTGCQDSPEAATAQWRKVGDQPRLKLPKLAAFMDEAEADVLAYMSFPREHWPK